MPRLDISDLFFSLKIQDRLRIISLGCQETLSETPFSATNAADVLDEGSGRSGDQSCCPTLIYYMEA